MQTAIPTRPFRRSCLRCGAVRRPMSAAALWGGLSALMAGGSLFRLTPAWTVTEEGCESSTRADRLIAPGDLDAARQMLDCDGLPITDRFPPRNGPLAFDGPGGAADFRFSFNQGAGLYVQRPAGRREWAVDPVGGWYAYVSPTHVPTVAWGHEDGR